ncbi:uncharacterized protein EV422DRAFT_563661 [Fimicolochytrium jonesii]|uniref:uncharacterized protein n=1 Tax=Fimicolochytrium jonesii TaxID=1396493 RepID=UPI0022FF3769|nr:uncharacterized protein EV422DRAFT_563661 [Fimicolochytrium jonesii]KAI8825828.1 hypothetical protein EV422DRAFT_563661 [Fimicolochytrium jonesii]
MDTSTPGTNGNADSKRTTTQFEARPVQRKGEERLHQGCRVRGVKSLLPRRDHTLKIRLEIIEEPGGARAKTSRYFLLSAPDYESVKKSQEEGTFSASDAKSSLLNSAFQSGHEILVVFTVENSRRFQGYGLMTAEAKADKRGDVADGAKSFGVQWIRTGDVHQGKVREALRQIEGGSNIKLTMKEELSKDVGVILCKVLDADCALAPSRPAVRKLEADVPMEGIQVSDAHAVAQDMRPHPIDTRPTPEASRRVNLAAEREPSNHHVAPSVGPAVHPSRLSYVENAINPQRTSLPQESRIQGRIEAMPTPLRGRRDRELLLELSQRLGRLPKRVIIKLLDRRKETAAHGLMKVAGRCTNRILQRGAVKLAWSRILDLPLEPLEMQNFSMTEDLPLWDVKIAVVVTPLNLTILHGTVRVSRQHNRPVADRTSNSNEEGKFA